MVSVNFDTSLSDVPVTQQLPSPDLLPFPPLFAFVSPAIFPRACLAVLDGTGVVCGVFGVTSAPKIMPGLKVAGGATLMTAVETHAYTGTSSQYLPIPCCIPALVLRTSLAHSRAIAVGQASRML
ncbi:hypothetical protein EV702DRAFT_1192749 [Suillus placidus]|uniref:Uncharacterized protein n=1 Tax=Suillus placidus TaxID=48579 RepID=A0A9P7A5H0_9AGAM|nr:hypothetical protein EV702DRAFT_1192749 [Suillus placidus]